MYASLMESIQNIYSLKINTLYNWKFSGEYRALMYIVLSSLDLFIYLFTLQCTQLYVDDILLNRTAIL